MLAQGGYRSRRETRSDSGRPPGQGAMLGREGLPQPPPPRRTPKRRGAFSPRPAPGPRPAASRRRPGLTPARTNLPPCRIRVPEATVLLLPLCSPPTSSLCCCLGPPRLGSPGSSLAKSGAWVKPLHELVVQANLSRPGQPRTSPAAWPVGARGRPAPRRRSVPMVIKASR